MTVVFRPQAEDESRAARRWYEEQKPGLGERFTEAIDATLRRIAANPLAFPRVHGQIRRAIAREFPFGVYFRVDGDDVVILAVMHGRRHPRRWRARG